MRRTLLYHIGSISRMTTHRFILHIRNVGLQWLSNTVKINLREYFLSNNVDCEVIGSNSLTVEQKKKKSWERQVRRNIAWKESGRSSPMPVICSKNELIWLMSLFAECVQISEPRAWWNRWNCSDRPWEPNSIAILFQIALATNGWVRALVAIEAWL